MYIMFTKKLLLLSIFLLSYCSCDSQNNIPTEVEESSYNSEEITFTSDGLQLEGTLFLPNTNSKVPGVVFVNGSGPLDRDGKAKNNPGAMPHVYKEWASFLSSNQLATLRYDKRFLTHSNLNPLEISQTDQINDIIAATAYLKSRTEIDASNIYIIGHSEGGSIAPVAAKRVNIVSGVIIISSPAFAIDTLFVEQLKANANIGQDLITQTEHAFLLLRNNQFPPGGQIWGGGEAYWSEWIEYSENATDIVLQLNERVLIQQGLEDENYPSFTLQKNIFLWEDISKQSDKISIRKYDNVTHLMQNKDTQQMAENVLNDIINWINQQ